MLWLAFSLGAAVFVGLKNVWTRSFAASIEAQTMVLATFLFTGVLSLVYLVATGMPAVDPRFYWSIVGASLVDALAVTLLTKAIFTADLSDAYPLVALTPVFALVTSFFILGEAPSLTGLVGVVVIVVGAYLLRVEGARESIFEPFRLLLRDRGARYMMLTALLFSVMGPLFKTAMHASSAGLALTASQWLTTLWLALVYLVGGTLRGTVREIRENFWPLAGLSATNFMQALFTLLGFQFAFVAYVASVKRLGILFTVLFGYLAFREKGALRGAAAGLVMLVGVILVSFGGGTR